MKHTCKSVFWSAFLSFLFLLFVVHSLSLASFSVTPVTTDESPPSPPNRLSPAEQYSGELLAYLLQVVLGRAGQPESREEWRVRAIDEPLDFARITKSMTDPEKNRLDYMVLDPNILDLSQVLFHYDEDLSLYKGEYGVTSGLPRTRSSGHSTLYPQKNPFRGKNQSGRIYTAGKKTTRCRLPTETGGLGGHRPVRAGNEISAGRFFKVSRPSTGI